MTEETLKSIYTESFLNNWDLPLYTDFNSDVVYTYHEVAQTIARFHLMFEHCGIKPGDKVAIFGRNSANWAVVFLSTITYGAVAVPILPDFKTENVHHIVNHSESKLLFCGQQLWGNLSIEEMPELTSIISINTFDVIHSSCSQLIKDQRNLLDGYFDKKYPKGFTTDSIEFNTPDNNELAIINYTSGTTGFSKGVMLSGNSIVGNLRYAMDYIPISPNAELVSFLPMAHAFGCLTDFLLPTALGCHIHYINKIPSPQILLEAFKKVQPEIIFTVPLIMDKIYKKKILPILVKPSVKILTRIPLLNRIIYKKIHNSLLESFGGKLIELVVGGAALNKDAEKLLRKIKFPFSIGYGMTECGPLISYALHDETKYSSAGRILNVMELKIDSPNPYKIPGEIMTRGKNVMMGYYKNQDATDECIDKDGWLHTGDLGITDKQDFIFIRGRSKTMLLGPSGQNIFPEELESRLNNMPYVAESLVLDDDNHKLVALVFPDYEALRQNNIKEEQLPQIMEQNRKALNHQVGAYENIMQIKLHQEEFIKTPKKSIKRFLYSVKKTD